MTVFNQTIKEVTFGLCGLHLKNKQKTCVSIPLDIYTLICFIILILVEVTLTFILTTRVRKSKTSVPFNSQSYLLI